MQMLDIAAMLMQSSLPRMQMYLDVTHDADEK
jgi:hypothetical protein